MGNKQPSELAFYVMGKEKDGQWQTNSDTQQWFCVYDRRKKEYKFTQNYPMRFGKILKVLEPICMAFCMHLINNKPFKPNETIYESPKSDRVETIARLVDKEVAVVELKDPCSVPSTIQMVITTHIIQSPSELDDKVGTFDFQSIYKQNTYGKKRDYQKEFADVVWDICKHVTRDTNVSDVIHQIVKQWGVRVVDDAKCDVISTHLKKLIQDATPNTRNDNTTIQYLVTPIIKQHSQDKKADLYEKWTHCATQPHTEELFEKWRRSRFDDLITNIWAKISNNHINTQTLSVAVGGGKGFPTTTSGRVVYLIS